MTGIVDHDRDGADVWSAALLKKEQERDALAARLAEAERRATTLQADLDRAIESALKANAINTDWRRDWKAAIARAEAAEARVRELEAAIQGAYGWLWLVNNEPGTPNQFEPEKAAYKARKVLRALLTHEQRGDGINRAMQEHRASPSARTALDDLQQMDHEDSKT